MTSKSKTQLLAEIKALQKRLAEPQTAENETPQKISIFKKQAQALGERVKELNCLYGISGVVETPGISLPEILQRSVELLPSAWQYPQITCTRITLDNREYKTKNFHETKWKLASEIIVEGKAAGSVEVFYLEEQPKSDQGPFLKEECALIDAVTEHLGRIIQRVGAQERVENLTLVLRAIRNVNQLIIKEKTPDVLIQKICDTLTETRGYSTAWIMLLDERGEYLDSAESGLGKSFTPLLKELKRGNFPACVQQSQARQDIVEINDPSSTCADCPITDAYSDKGRMTIRLEHAEKVYGILSVSFGVNITVDEEEFSVFEEVAEDIAFTLHNFKLEENVKQVAQNLQESEDYQKTIFETSSLPTSIIEEDTTISMVNKQFEKISGYSKEELEGKMSWTKFVAADDLRRMKDYHQQRRIDPNTTSKQYEFKFINREGIVRNILLNVDMIPGTKQSVASLLDITERKSFEQEMQNERDKAQKYLDIAEVMIVALNKEGEITLVNQKGTSILGYQTEELIGKNWFITCVPESDRKQTKKLFDKFIAGRVGLGGCFEQIIITKSGEERIIDWHSTPLCEWVDDEKRRIGSLSSGEDITDRIQAKEQNRRFSKIIETTSQSVIITNIKGTVLYVNQSYYNFSGFVEDEVIGQSMYHFASKKGAFELAKEVVPALIRKKHWQGGMIVLKKNKKSVPVN